MDAPVPPLGAPIRMATRAALESSTVVNLDSGRHEFKIIGYSRCQNIGIGKWITSRTFTVGGHQWQLRFYPNGENTDVGEYVSIFLELVNATASCVNTLFDIRFLDTVSGTLCTGTPENAGPHDFAPNETFGFYKFMHKKDLEASGYLRDDCLTIRCNVVVIKDVDVDVADGLAKASIDEPDD